MQRSTRGVEAVGHCVHAHDLASVPITSATIATARDELRSTANTVAGTVRHAVLECGTTGGNIRLILSLKGFVFMHLAATGPSMRQLRCRNSKRIAATGSAPAYAGTSTSAPIRALLLRRGTAIADTASGGHVVIRDLPLVIVVLVVTNVIVVVVAAGVFVINVLLTVNLATTLLDCTK